MELQHESDVTGSLEKVKGSDNRQNVSSRADGRGYYNSRDESESFSLTFADASATTDDYVVFLSNDKTDGKDLVIRSASINGAVASSFEFLRVSGTPSGGAVAATPFNLNVSGKTKSATATAMTVVNSNSSPIGGVSDVGLIDHVSLVANGHEEFRFHDQLRIGQDQCIAIKMRSGAADSACFGVIFFYFEQGKS